MLSLQNLEKTTEKRKRIGRGGDQGGTSGKGHKGQKARSGGNISPAFEGGQMALSRRLPKRGFNNKRFATQVQIINLQDLQHHFEDGATVDRAALFGKRLVKKTGNVLIKVLGKGTLSKKLTIRLDLMSKSAREAIIQAGGKVQGVEELESGTAA